MGWHGGLGGVENIKAENVFKGKTRSKVDSGRRV